MPDPMPPRFTSFVILAEMRTGSNFLEANLNALPGVVSHGEVFNPHFIGRKDNLELFGMTLAEREANPRAMLDRIRAASPGLTGFRFFHDHDARVFDLVLDDPTCAKIVLTRNPLDSYVSWKIARATGQWTLTDPRRLKPAKAVMDPDEFRTHLARMQAFQVRLLQGLQKRGQTAFYLDYEDLTSVEALNGLAAYLGVEGRLKAADDTLKKQNPGPVEEKLENPEVLAEALAGLDVFALSRTPNFEPRRPVPLPALVAVDAARLLFLPVASGPQAAVVDWLAALAPLRQGFDGKGLRDWRRAHPGHRSFTVVRHPLLRAYVAFRDQILTGQLADHRRSLIVGYKAKLPEPGAPFADPRDERAAFRIFLHYCRLATSGQAGRRVDPNWASQTAILQGFAALHPVDLVLREDRLAEGLAYLAAEVGLTAPPLPSAAPDSQTAIAAAALARIHDPVLDAAAEAAFARDFQGFGFGPWQP